MAKQVTATLESEPLLKYILESKKSLESLEKMSSASVMQQSNYHFSPYVISMLDFRQTISKLNRASESRKILIWT